MLENSLIIKTGSLTVVAVIFLKHKFSHSSVYFKVIRRFVKIINTNTDNVKHFRRMAIFGCIDDIKQI